MQKFLRYAIAAMIVASCTGANAVTKQEMEQARALTAKAWMRCANNGSDYLDPLSPSSLQELETKLKAIEKENIKKFKSVGAAADYASWDRDRLAQYWSSVFLADPALKIENIGYAKKMAYNAINAMKVADPVPAEDASPTASNQNPDENMATPALPDPIASAEEVDAFSQNDGSQLKAAEDSLLNMEGDKIETDEKASDGSTTIYIIILCALVAAVIALVIYATKVFRKPDDNDDFIDSPSAREKENNKQQEPRHTTVNINTAPAPSLSENELMASRNREIKSLAAENAELRREIEDYKLHIRNLKEKLAAYQGAPIVRKPVEEQIPEPTKREATPQRRERTIYLGRASRDGIFTRAERELNPEQSVFRLVSSDGLTGTYTIVDDPQVETRILEDTRLIDNAVSYPETDGYHHDSIMTERSGTAIFESGRWRVLRKAQIRLI